MFTRRYDELDLTVGLVVGSERCLVIDTRGSRRQGAELAAAVGEVTATPPVVAVTHAHFDHAFGAAAFADRPIWAHAGCRDALAEHGPRDRREWTERYRRAGAHAAAEDLAATPITVPNHIVDRSTHVDLGGRSVALVHPGPGHTAHDVIAVAGDVVFAGDLVEHAPGGSFTDESFGPDAHLDAWPAALERLLEYRPRLVVPGHGDPVDGAFVAQARADLRALAGLRADVGAGTRTLDEAVADSPLPAEATRAALT